MSSPLASPPIQSDIFEDIAGLILPSEAPTPIDISLDARILPPSEPTKPQTRNPSLLDSMLSRKMNQWQPKAPEVSVNALSDSVPRVVEHKSRGRGAWLLVGVYSTEANMQVERKARKVSKRKSNSTKAGLKVVYRCNAWKRQGCRYSMYALHCVDGKIALYERGKHQHSIESKITRTPKVEKEPVSMVAQANSQHSTLMDVDYSALMETPIQSTPLITERSQDTDASTFDSSSQCQSAITTTQSPEFSPELCLKQEEDLSSAQDSLVSTATTVEQQVPERSLGSFSLGDGQHIARLLEIATEMDLTFTFNSRRVYEYCFESNITKDKTLVFADFADLIRVSERYQGHEAREEWWTKADWNQFQWALRARCTYAFGPVN